MLAQVERQSGEMRNPLEETLVLMEPGASFVLGRPYQSKSHLLRVRRRIMCHLEGGWPGISESVHRHANSCAKPKWQERLGFITA